MKRYYVEQTPLYTILAIQAVLTLTGGFTAAAFFTTIKTVVAGVCAAKAMTINARDHEELDAMMREEHSASYEAYASHRVRCWRVKDFYTTLSTGLMLLTAAEQFWKAVDWVAFASAACALFAVTYQRWVFPKWRKSYLAGRL